MALDDKKNGRGEVCTCMGGGCGRSRHWTFFLLRVLITVIILMFVFWFGVAVGRMSSYVRFGGMMRTYTDETYGDGVGGPGGMMPIYNASSSQWNGGSGVQNY